LRAQADQKSESCDQTGPRGDYEKGVLPAKPPAAEGGEAPGGVEGCLRSGKHAQEFDASFQSTTRAGSFAPCALRVAKRLRRRNETLCERKEGKESHTGAAPRGKRVETPGGQGQRMEGARSGCEARLPSGPARLSDSAERFGARKLP